jgi:hypothetical protein
VRRQGHRSRLSRWNWSQTRQHCERKNSYTNSTQ